MGGEHTSEVELVLGDVREDLLGLDWVDYGAVAARFVHDHVHVVVLECVDWYNVHLGLFFGYFCQI